MATKKEEKCSFCGKARNEVFILIPDVKGKVFICDTCIKEAEEHLQNAKIAAIVQQMVQSR